jgi:hypothetical protein
MSDTWTAARMRAVFEKVKNWDAGARTTSSARSI